MRGSVVGNPEHSASGAVGLLAHDLRDQALEWSDSGLVLAPSEQLGTMNVPGGEVCPGALACCGRDASYLAPPAQIRTCSFPAYGSYLESLTAMLRLGQGWRIRGRGSHSFISWVI